MTELKVRRVVTGHNEHGKAVVVADGPLPVGNPRPDDEVCVVWTTDRVPADNLNAEDGGLKALGSRVQNGVAFRIVRYAPGRAGCLHRTQTIDYGVVVSGNIILQLDDGAEVALAQGDVLVQRGTVHAWRNDSSEPCTMAFALIDAEPLP